VSTGLHIESISPAEGSVAGGTLVTLEVLSTWSEAEDEPGFGTFSTCRFDSHTVVDALYSPASDGSGAQLRCHAPPADEPRRVTVEVSLDGHEYSTNAMRFKYLPLAPMDGALGLDSTNSTAASRHLTGVEAESPVEKEMRSPVTRTAGDDSFGGMSAGVSMGVGHSEFSGPFDTSDVSEEELKSRREYALRHNAEGPFRIGVDRKDHLESEHAYHVRPTSRPSSAASASPWDFPAHGVLSTDVLTSGYDGCRRDTGTPISYHRC
jgi:hypothetical protein